HRRISGAGEKRLGFMRSREISEESEEKRWKVLAQRLENLSFPPEQKAWLRDLMACMKGEETPPSTEEVHEVFLCKICGERFFFRREAYGPEDCLLCPECGEAFSLPPRGEEKA
ncbi:MAG TPA: hypothetical protein PK364_05390, partial [Synergistaceae bacterium]|nr:hypothetical protein [Synergistaceae bacterium]